MAPIIKLKPEESTYWNAALPFPHPIWHWDLPCGHVLEAHNFESPPSEFECLVCKANEETIEAMNFTITVSFPAGTSGPGPSVTFNIQASDLDDAIAKLGVAMRTWVDDQAKSLYSLLPKSAPTPPAA